MPDTSAICRYWMSTPPQALLIGDGAYSGALSLVLGAGSIGPAELLVGLGEPGDTGYPQVLRGLERAIIVAGASQSASDILRCHAALWRWIEKLSPEGDQHEVAILLVLPQSSGDSLAESMAIGLGLEKFDPELGHGIARMGDSLEFLCQALSAIRPCDLPPLRARQEGNARHKAIRQLAVAGDQEELTQAARNVAECFAGEEYHLDLFCRPPSHRNGNQLRKWLQEAVTNGVTPDSVESTKSSLAEWIRTE